MRIITLEEHVAFQEFAARIPADLKAAQNSGPAVIKKLAPLLEDVSRERIRSMDDNSISNVYAFLSRP